MIGDIRRPDVISMPEEVNFLDSLVILINMANANLLSTRLDDVQLSEYMGAIEHQFMGEGYYWTLVQSTINGYHAYKVKPPIEVQLPCTREPDNPYDARAVVCKGLDGDVIGHVPKDLASIFTWFLEKSYTDLS